MKSVVSLAVAVLAFLLWSGPAPAAEFSADMVHTTKGYTSTTKIYVKDQKTRTEPQGRGQAQYTIARGDLQKTWVVMPAQKAYMEMAYDPSKSPDPGTAAGTVSRRLIGQETVNGRPTEKYEVTIRAGGREVKSYQWWDTGLKFPVKSAALDGSWTQEYRNIRVGSQPDSLFEVPSGYAKREMPGYPGAGMPGRKK